jgi:hypothetical protein
MVRLSYLKGLELPLKIKEMKRIKAGCAKIRLD